MRALSYLHNPPTAPYQYLTINDVIKKTADAIPNTEAYVYRPAQGPRQSITYKELYDRARGVAQFLITSGVQRQATVGLFGPNTLARVVAEFGILLSGAVVLQLNIELKNSKDAVDVLNKNDCQVIFTDPGNDDSLLPIIESLKTVDENSAKGRQFIFLRETNSSKLIFTVMDDIAKQVEDGAVLPEVYPEDDALVFTTSGSTGKPKMVVHSHFLVTCLLQTDELFGERSISYNDRPFCWIGGTVMITSMVGNTLVFTDSTLATTGKDIKTIWNILREEKVDNALLLPYCIHDLITEKANIPDDGFRLNRISTSGQVIDNFYTKVVGRFCKALMIAYGSTESGGVAYSVPYDEGDVLETGKIGPPIPGVEIRIVDEDGCTVTIGKQGNIQVRSAFVMKRYQSDTSMTNDVFTTDRPPWFKTGDVGLLTSSGDVVVRGRMKENISRGGRKILPGAVDDVVKKMQGIRHVATVAVPDTRMYEEACVCYVASDITPTDVQSYCGKEFVNKDSLDGMGFMPKYFLKFDEFPILHTGKIDKLKLKAEATMRLNLTK